MSTIEQDRVADRQVRAGEAGHLKAWMPLWLFPLGLLGAVVLLSLASLLGYLLAIAWGFVLIPHGANYILTHPRSAGDGDGIGSPGVNTDYWRTVLR